LLRSTIASNYLGKGELVKTKELLDLVGGEIEKIDTLESVVYAKFYQAFATYYKKLGDAAQFYKNSLLFLAYVQTEKISIEEKRALSVELIISALVAEDIFSFGELVSQPIISSLNGTEDHWLVEFVNAFNEGKKEKYQLLKKKPTKPNLMKDLLIIPMINYSLKLIFSL